MKHTALTLLAAAALIAGSVVAQDTQTFRGAGKSASGSSLTVSGGDETHTFQISGSTTIVDNSGKKTNLQHALNQSVEVTYTGEKEPYRAIKVECLEQ